MKKPNIILVIASSIDGRLSFPINQSTHIGSFEDKKILNDAISKVDATIFGSGTLRVHQSTFLIKKFIDKTKFIIKNHNQFRLLRVTLIIFKKNGFILISQLKDG